MKKLSCLIVLLLLVSTSIASGEVMNAAIFGVSNKMSLWILGCVVVLVLGFLIVKFSPIAKLFSLTFADSNVKELDHLKDEVASQINAGSFSMTDRSILALEVGDSFVALMGNWKLMSEPTQCERGIKFILLPPERSGQLTATCFFVGGVFTTISGKIIEDLSYHLQGTMSKPK